MRLVHHDSSNLPFLRELLEEILRPAAALELFRREKDEFRILCLVLDFEVRGWSTDVERRNLQCLQRLHLILDEREEWLHDYIGPLLDEPG